MNENSAGTPTPKISVIIPIYNTASYLNEALSSICNQTLKELEIILINDGSTDQSQAIIEEYTRKDDRVKYTVQPNQGLSVARNNGLQQATGEYIYFMDSDDMLDPNALEECYNICKKRQLDCVFFDAETFCEDSQIKQTFNYCRKGVMDENKIWNGTALLLNELKKDIFQPSACLCFTRHSFLKEYFRGFPPGIIHEDHIFALQLRLNAKRICYIPQPFFKRRVRANSIMTTQFGMRNIEGYTRISTEVQKWKSQHPEWNAIINLYLEKTLNAVIWLGHSMTLLEKIETYCRFRRLRLKQYVHLRNWMVFWFKKNKNIRKS